MIRSGYIMFLLASLLPCLPAQADEVYVPREARHSLTANADWTFMYFPSGEETPEVASTGYDDSSWPAIALPHTWFTYETTGDIHPFIRSAAEREDAYWWNGWGWYRKHIRFGKELEGKHISVEFDGVQKYAKVYMNGCLVGEHKGGYTSFYFDLTPYINFGEDNILAVQVSSRRDDRFGTIPPATAGNFNVYGGIYRDVRIVVRNRVHIPFQGSYRHEGGTFVTTPEVSHDSAFFRLKTYIVNGSDKDRDILLKSIVTDMEGNVLQTIVSDTEIRKGEMACVEQESGIFDNPHLWCPESPYLYHIYSEVYDETGELLDNYTTPLGFRWFEWDHEAGTLVLNGERIHIHGTNRHQEYPWLGDAMPRWLTERDTRDIRHGMNTNFMRTAHYPQSPMIYDLHDSLGIITVEEVPNDKNIEFDRQVQENNMREMVRRDRNHPSIMFWSVGNETSCAADSRWTWEEDSTRIIHERKTEGYGDYVTHHASDLDMENLLRVTVRGWTDTDVKDREPRNNAEVAKSGQMAGTEEWQHTMARVRDGSIRGRIDGNIVCWLYADHGCDRMYMGSPLRNINYKGWVDAYRFPKYMYYLWQANYLEEPMVFVHPHYWQEKYTGQKKTFRVDSNCQEVELFVNGKSMGRAYPDEGNFHTVEFNDIPVENGILTAVATDSNGKTVTHEIRMAGEPYRIVLSSLGGPLTADRSGLDVIVADVTDRDGNSVQGFTGTLKWSIEGEGTLAGPEIYESDMDKELETDGSGYVTTPVSNIIRATAAPGRIHVTVSSEGLVPGKMTLESFAPEKKAVKGIFMPELSDTGREKIVRDSSFAEKVCYVEEMAPIFSPEQIQAESYDEYADYVRHFVLGKNPGMDSLGIEFGYLIRRLASYLENTHGELTEDDYNFMAGSYNRLRMICKAIDNRNFHPLYAETLKTDYSERMLSKGELVDTDKEMAFINGIPSALDIVIIRNPGKSSQKARVQYGNTSYRYSVVASSLEEAVRLLRPEISDAVLGSTLAATAMINPFVRQDGNSYKFEFDKAIAIPRKI